MEKGTNNCKINRNTKVAGIASLIAAICLASNIVLNNILQQKNQIAEGIDLETMQLNEKIELLLFSNMYGNKVSNFFGSNMYVNKVSNFLRCDMLRNTPNIGFIHLFGADLSNIEDSKKMISDFIHRYIQKGMIPPLISIDFEGGFVHHIDISEKELRKFGFPQNLLKIREKEYVGLEKKHHKTEVGLGVLPSAEFLGIEYAKIRKNRKQRQEFLKMMRDYGKAVANMCNYLGVNMVLGPVLDQIHDLDGENLIAKDDRSFGTDSGIISELGTSYIQGFKGTNVLPIPKHFAGSGLVAGDLHEKSSKAKYKNSSGLEIPFGDVLMRGYPVTTVFSKKDYRQKEPRDEVEELYKRRSIPQGVLVGQSFNSHYCPNTPDTLCENVYSTLERQKNGYGFQGLKITDDMTMGAVDEYLAIHQREISPENKIFLAIKNGADVVLHRYISGKYEEITQGIIEELEMNKNKETILRHINQSVQRILDLRVKIGNMTRENGKYFYKKKNDQIT